MQISLHPFPLTQMPIETQTIESQIQNSLVAGINSPDDRGKKR